LGVLCSDSDGYRNFDVLPLRSWGDSCNKKLPLSYFESHNNATENHIATTEMIGSERISEQAQPQQRKQKIRSVGDKIVDDAFEDERVWR
jgi:hypothetical protein